MTKKETDNLIKLAQRTIYSMEHREDLERHFSDEEDFLDISVWELKAALEAAYELGKASK